MQTHLVPTPTSEIARAVRRKPVSVGRGALDGALQRAEIRQILQGSRVQAKLTVGPPDDAYEREADQVANSVMRMPAPGAPESLQRESLQRKCTECEEEDKVQRKTAEDGVEEGFEEDQETLLAKAGPGGVPRIGAGLEARIQALRGGGQALPTGERSFFEPRFGQDFGGVRIHQGGRAAEVARAVNARAFTVGRDVVFGSGEYRPGTTEGRSLMAHELTHVVQQGGGTT